MNSRYTWTPTHLALSFEVDPALSVTRFFADGLVEFLVFFFRDVLVLSRPNSHIIVHAVPAPDIDLINS